MLSYILHLPLVIWTWTISLSILRPCHTSTYQLKRLVMSCHVVSIVFEPFKPQNDQIQHVLPNSVDLILKLIKAPNTETLVDQVANASATAARILFWQLQQLPGLPSETCSYLFYFVPFKRTMCCHSQSGRAKTDDLPWTPSSGKKALNV